MKKILKSTVDRENLLSLKIEKMKNKLDTLINNEASYDEILECSVKLDVLIAEYMKQELALCKI